jgi:hypothetical protein
MLSKKRFAIAQRPQGLVVVEPRDERSSCLTLELCEVACAKSGLPYHAGQEVEQRLEVTSEHRRANAG